MGLDAVELVMETEERFGVHLPDEECAHIRTVADLAALVISKLTVESAACPTSRTFYRVRRAFVDGGISRKNVRPGTRLSDLDPKKRRRTLRKLRRLEGGLRPRPIPPDFVTVADLVRHMTPKALPTDLGERIIAEYQVLDAVREIASNQLGVPFERVRPESDFVNDLGMG
jgi:acyl carrier protein